MSDEPRRLHPVTYFNQGESKKVDKDFSAKIRKVEDEVPPKAEPSETPKPRRSARP